MDCNFHGVCFRAVVEVLLNAGMDVNVRTAAGTALHEAAPVSYTHLDVYKRQFSYS